MSEPTPNLRFSNLIKSFSKLSETIEKVKVALEKLQISPEEKAKLRASAALVKSHLDYLVETPDADEFFSNEVGERKRQMADAFLALMERVHTAEMHDARGVRLFFPLNALTVYALDCREGKWDLKRTER